MPSEVVPNYEQNEDFLKKVHHVILEVYNNTVYNHMPSYYSKPMQANLLWVSNFSINC